MNIFNMVRGEIEAVIAGIVVAGQLPEGMDLSRIAVEPPRDPAHGDVATNAAMVLSKQAGMKPRDLAAILRDGLVESTHVLSADIAGPGFINLRLADAVWGDVVRVVLDQGLSYGESGMGAGRPVNVEYVSANPTGPLHIGHARGAVVGDALARLLDKAGFAVCKEYYINDAGVQIDTLARSAHLRYREALGEDIGDIPDGLYPGDYLISVGEALAAEVGDSLKDKPEAEWIGTVRLFTVDRMMDLVRADLKRLGIEQEVFSSERALVEAGAVDEVLAEFDANGLLYTGVLEPPKGMKPEDWEPRPQTLFKATDFGDDIDRPLKKSDGTWTYFATDIAYHRDKMRRGFNHQIDIWGADHGGYVKRMQAAVRAASGGEAALTVKLCQMVKIMDKGEPVKMSKRAGTFVTVRDLVEAVGKDVVRFYMLTRKNDAPLDFDLTAVKEQSRDNPVFYVQYAHARCRSVFRMAGDILPDADFSPAALANADLALLDGEAERAAIKLMAAFPRQIEAAAEAEEPHRIAYYLQDLASAFHAMWTKGKDDAALRVIREDDLALTSARLALVEALRTVIASGLAVFGVEPVEELH